MYGLSAGTKNCRRRREVSISADSTVVSSNHIQETNQGLQIIAQISPESSCAVGSMSLDRDMIVLSFRAP